jgi:uncharacterized C2H2 Zn-finger protein
MPDHSDSANTKETVAPASSKGKNKADFLKCPLCPALAFEDARSYIDHGSSMHKTARKGRDHYDCPYCPSIFFKFSELRKHLVKVEGLSET